MVFKTIGEAVVLTGSSQGTIYNYIKTIKEEGKESEWIKQEEGKTLIALEALKDKWGNSIGEQGKISDERVALLEQEVAHLKERLKSCQDDKEYFQKMANKMIANEQLKLLSEMNEHERETYILALTEGKGGKNV